MPGPSRVAAAFVLLVAAVCPIPSFAQLDSSAFREQILTYRAAHEKQLLTEFVDLLSIPNHASDQQGIERNAATIQKMLQARGVAVQLLRIPGAPPLVYGELHAPGARSTIGIYAHYDGQPVDPKQWRNPPFSPILRDAAGRQLEWASLGTYDPESRIYARSSSDDKAPVEGTMAALDALQASHIPLSTNVKFLFEGEEEAGSPHLADLLQQHPDTLLADIWLLCDGPVHQSRRMQVYFGARGETDLEMTVYGPARPLHSGHYGNWAPNPIILLTHLLDSMRDTDARILIPGFYADVRPLTPAEKQVLAETPPVDDQLKKELGLATPEGDGAPIAEQILKPAFNIRGIQAGHVGSEAANVISTEARASIDFRLVPDQTPDKVRQEVKDFITKQGFFIVHEAPDLATRQAHARVVKLDWGSGYPPYRASIDNPAAQNVLQAIEDGIGSPAIKVVSLGGSIPMYLFEGRTHTPVIGVPIANHDNNQHAADENLRLQNLWDAIQIYAAIFARYGEKPAAGH
ncbi:MAG TPA: M20/M25/M40 family metallo-hydrolase [Terriglobales bacterium]|nr:M20/M25/M40 family metallo-hydrolase [Terriglobales bacterium]